MIEKILFGIIIFYLTIEKIKSIGFYKSLLSLFEEIKKQNNRNIKLIKNVGKADINNNKDLEVTVYGTIDKKNIADVIEQNNKYLNEV